MIIGTCKVYMAADWVYSLKEKRMVVKSITNRVRNKFNVSIAEIENQDIHRSIALGFACVTNSRRLADEILQNVLNFVENNTEVVIEDVITEVL